LLSNAIKFTAQGQVNLWVSLFHDNQRLLFAVRDTGIGITPEQMLRLFQLFSQGDASTTRQYGGSGLGLMICKRLTNLMGGQLWLESQGAIAGDPPSGFVSQMQPGDSGSTVYFTLCLTPVEMTALTVPQPTALPEPHSNPALRVLLAEDNVVNQKVALHLLARLGYRADVVSDGQEAIEALRRQPYDVVLMDVQMPRLSGLQAAQIIRQEWTPSERPHLIAMTANAMVGDEQRCLNAGMDDYLSKPIQIQTLARVLQKCHSAGRSVAGRVSC
jgi:CheY-like chemotaxis protein